MNKTIGILAHVDAGKTTLSEQLLYHTHSIRTRGRVDHKDAFLDSDPLERERGITIFSDQAVFSYNGNTYFLVDTPGHVDFSAEMERSLRVLDYAVLVVSCVEGVQGHTETVWKLLRRCGVPTLLFLNKTDREGADPGRVLGELQGKFGSGVCDFTDGFGHGAPGEALLERAAERDDGLMERYLDGAVEAGSPEAEAELARLVREQKLFPCFRGSALQDQGVEEFLQDMDLLTATGYDPAAPFAARVYKVRHDPQGSRLTFLKITGGVLRVKETVNGEKINEMRRYNGARYVPLQEASAGELCAVTGLSRVRVGDGLGEAAGREEYVTAPTLQARVEFPDSVPARTMLGYFRVLEDEDPMLSVRWEEALQEIHVRIMGSIQLEVLAALVRERFRVDVGFGPCEILYQETIADTVTGYGHFEPLRHYAEVHLRLSPNPRGAGVTFESACSTDVLDHNWQHLIRTHVFEREHKGVLTGSPLTDVKVTLLTGATHLKHTEGGDMREATYRAIRQGLEQAQSLLLEPYYAFSIQVPTELMGRVLADVQKRHGSFEPPQAEGDRTVVNGRAPVAAMMNYSQEVTSYSRGRGTVSLVFDGYEPCHNPEEVIAARAYDKIRDVENTSDSIFCSHGAGFKVPWDQVKDHIHVK